MTETSYINTNIGTVSPDTKNISLEIKAFSKTVLNKNGKDFLHGTSEFVKVSLAEYDCISIAQTTPIFLKNTNPFTIIIDKITLYDEDGKKKAAGRSSTLLTIPAHAENSLWLRDGDSFHILKEKTDSDNESDVKKKDDTIKTIYEVSGPKGTTLYKSGGTAPIYFDMTEREDLYIKDSIGAASYISIGPEDKDTNITIHNVNSFPIIITEENADGSLENRIKIETKSKRSLKFTKSNKFYITRTLDESSETLFNLFLEKINNVEKKGCHLEFADLLNLCEVYDYCDIVSEKIINEKTKKSRKKRSPGLAQPGSWKSPEDWELHNQYIFEVFNPQTTEYSLPKPKEKLKPGEKLEEVTPSFTDNFLIKLIPPANSTHSEFYTYNASNFKLIWDLIDSAVSQDKPIKEEYRTLKTVRKTEQALKLKDIDVEDAQKQEKQESLLPPESLYKTVIEIINQMITYQTDNKLGRIQSDHIMELYKRAPTIQSLNQVFYQYTDAERRSPSNRRQQKQNSEQSSLDQNNFQKVHKPKRLLESIAKGAAAVVSGLFYGGRILGDPNSSPILPLGMSVLFGAPKKCE